MQDPWGSTLISTASGTVIRVLLSMPAGFAMVTTICMQGRQHNIDWPTGACLWCWVECRWTGLGGMCSWPNLVGRHPALHEVAQESNTEYEATHAACRPCMHCSHHGSHQGFVADLPTRGPGRRVNRAGLPPLHAVRLSVARCAPPGPGRAQDVLDLLGDSLHLFLRCSCTTHQELTMRQECPTALEGTC